MGDPKEAQSCLRIRVRSRNQETVQMFGRTDAVIAFNMRTTGTDEELMHALISLSKYSFWSKLQPQEEMVPVWKE